MVWCGCTDEKSFRKDTDKGQCAQGFRSFLQWRVLDVSARMVVFSFWRVTTGKHAAFLGIQTKPRWKLRVWSWGNIKFIHSVQSGLNWKWLGTQEQSSPTSPPLLTHISNLLSSELRSSLVSWCNRELNERVLFLLCFFPGFVQREIR